MPLPPGGEGTGRGPWLAGVECGADQGLRRLRKLLFCEHRIPGKQVCLWGRCLLRRRSWTGGPLEGAVWGGLATPRSLQPRACGQAACPLGSAGPGAETKL